MGDPYQCYQPISLHQLLAVVVFSLITSCQYANKLPRLFSILWLRCKIYDRNDDFFFLPLHFFMISKYVVCAVLLLFSCSSCSCLYSGNVFTDLHVPNFSHA